GTATCSNSRCALPHLIVPRGAHQEGTGAAALCPCHAFLSPPFPLPRGICQSRRSWMETAVPPCKHLECNAVGLLRQGLASLHTPAGWPPLPGCQHGQEGASDGPQCGGRSTGAGWRAARGQRAPHVRQDKPGFLLITCRYAAI